ncbi:MAG: thioredoxin-like domain-containing protein [Bacteroidales bacterium]
MRTNKFTLLSLVCYVGFLGAALSWETSFASVGSKASNVPNVKKGFELRVKINNYPDSLQHVVLLGRYYGNIQTITDSAKYDAKTNTYLFSQEEPKGGGLYLLISADKRYAEFVLDKDQHLSIETTYPNLGEDPKFSNSPENIVYMDFAEKGKTEYLKMEKLQKEYKTALDSNDNTKIGKLKEAITIHYKKMDEQKNRFAETYPEHLISAIFKAQKEIEVPEAPTTIPDSLKREWQYEYYKNHYFDNIDLCDDRLLRTPIFHQRFDNFLEKVLYMQSPDTIKYAVERLIEKCRCNKELFKYTIWYPVDKYQRSDIVGQDAIWVYLAKKYYATGEAYWVSPAIVENFTKRISRVEPLLIGNRPPEFACPDSTVDTPNENLISVFSSPKRYTVLIFWSMSCGHCKTSLPQWLDFYHKKGKELDVEIIAICKDFDVPAWKKYIQDHGFDWINLNGKTATVDYNDLWDIQTTPTVYIIDRQKRIVTKRIDSEYAENFIKNWNLIYYNEH